MLVRRFSFWALLVLLLLVSIVLGVRQLRATLSPAVSCVDSDGGLGYFAYGSVTVQNGDSYQALGDICQTTRVLQEYLCNSDGSVGFESVDCPAGCYLGACVDAAQSSCTDSDTGSFYAVPGIVSGVSRGEPYSYADVCSDEGTLVEYMCDGPTPITDPFDGQGVHCPHGCRDGACIADDPEYACFDEDNGNDPVSRGSISGFWHFAPFFFEERCLDESYLLEFACINGSATQVDDGNGAVYCPGGCFDGACIPVQVP